MTFRVVVHPEAESDLVATHDFIATHSPQAALEWYDSCGAAIVSQSEYPRRCPVAPESAGFGREIRQLIHYSHRILFTIVGDEVHVLYVRHAARLPLEPE